MPKVIIRGFVNDEYTEEMPCLYLDVTPELVGSWLARIEKVKELFRGEDSIYCLSFWDSTGEFFNLYALGEVTLEVDELLDELRDRVVEEEAVVLEEGTAIYRLMEQRLENHRFDAEPGARMRTDVDLLEVTARGVQRCSSLKHTNVQVETIEITVEMLASFL